MQTVFPPCKLPTIAVVGCENRFPVRRIYCVGRNYADHAREMGADPDREAPFFFSKPADAIVGTAQKVAYPSQTQELHHEVELVIALKKGGNDISAKQATNCIFGYAVGIDLTRRDLQAQAKKHGRPWCTSKGFDQSALIGPITEPYQCGHLENADITLEVNGQVRQSGNTKQMIWSCAEIVSELSKYFRMERGDIIFTGTPAGVAELKPGDKIKANVSGLAGLVKEIV